MGTPGCVIKGCALQQPVVERNARAVRRRHVRHTCSPQMERRSPRYPAASSATPKSLTSLCTWRSLLLCSKCRVIWEKPGGYVKETGNPSCNCIPIFVPLHTNLEVDGHPPQQAAARHRGARGPERLLGSSVHLCRRQQEQQRASRPAEAERPRVHAAPQQHHLPRCMQFTLSCNAYIRWSTALVPHNSLVSHRATYCCELCSCALKPLVDATAVQIVLPGGTPASGPC